MALHRGKIATHPEILEVRALTRDDLALLLEKRADSNGRPIQGAVARFRDPHHRVARLFASGLRPVEVAERSGYSYNRIHILSTDPAFQELIARYREKVDAAFVQNADQFYETATSNMRTAERMIAERLEKADSEDIEVPLKTLVDISADRMDRFGYGKRQTNLNVNADFASLLEKAIVRSGKAPALIEATAVTRSPQSPLEEPSHAHSSRPPEESQQPPSERKLLRRA